MKKLIFLTVSLFFIISISSCKTNDSEISYLTESTGTTVYLFGTSSGKDGTDVICRLESTGSIYKDIIHKQLDEFSLDSAVYVKEAVLAKDKYFKKFLTYINDKDNTTPKKLNEDESKNIYHLFDEAETLLKEDGAFDSNIGDPKEVCEPLLDLNKTSEYFIATRTDFFPFVLYDDKGKELNEINSPYLNRWKDKKTGLYWTYAKKSSTLDDAKETCENYHTPGLPYYIKWTWQLPTISDFYNSSEYPACNTIEDKNRLGKFCEYVYGKRFWVINDNKISEEDFSKRHSDSKLNEINGTIFIDFPTDLRPLMFTGDQVLCIYKQDNN